MRLLIITSDDVRREYGGGEVYVRNLLDALVKAGHSVTATADVADIGRNKPDVVHAHARKVAAARVAREAGVPCVVTMHHGGLVCPQGALLDWEDRVCHRPVEQEVCTRCCLRGRTWGNVPLGVGRFLRRLPNIPFVTPAMTTPLTVADKRKEIAALGRDVTMFVAPSHAVQDTLLRNGIQRERVAVVLHGIAPLTAQPLPEAPPLRFACVGRADYVKGLHVLVAAFRRLRGTSELHIIGAAHNKREQHYLRGLGTPSRVVFHGHLTGKALVDAWSQCHVTVLPSICLEVFGLVIPESFALGRPVIVTDCGGPPELVRDGTDGFVVPSNNPEALATAMQRFVDTPDFVGECATRLPKVRSMTDHVADLEKVYSQCVSVSL